MRHLLLSLLALLCSISLHAENTDYARHITMGDSLRALFDLQSALPHYESAYRLKATAEATMRLADVYYQRGRQADCARLLQTLPTDSLSHDAFRELFYCFYLNKDYKHSLSWGQKLLQRFPKDGQVTAETCNALNMEDLPEKAIGIAEAYLKGDPDNVPVLGRLAFARFYLKEYETAATLYDRLEQLGDTVPNTLYLSGLAHEQLRHFERARALFERAALASAFKNGMTLYHLASVLDNLDQLPEAFDYANKAVDAMQPDPKVMTGMWELKSNITKRGQRIANETRVQLDSLYSLKAYGEAEKAFIFALNHVKPWMDNRFWLGGARVAMRLKQHEKALDRLEEMLNVKINRQVSGQTVPMEEFAALHTNPRWGPIGQKLSAENASRVQFIDHALQAQVLSPSFDEAAAGALLDSCGWVSRTKLGAGCDTIYSKIAHGSVETMERYLPVLMLAGGLGDIDLRQVAELQDRIDVLRQRPQHYGTQIETLADGTRRVYPVLNRQRLDDMRQQMNLKSMALFLEESEAKF